MRHFAELGCCAVFLLLTACRSSNPDQQEKIKQDAQKRVDQVQSEAKKLGGEIKDGAKKLDRDVRQAVNSTGTASGTESASDKLQHATDVAKGASVRAGQKLSQASVLAQIKTKLASDLGLSSVANVNTDVAGTVVTLSGTVKSEDEKQRAEQSASQVDGVSKVVNELKVQP